MPTALEVIAVFTAFGVAASIATLFLRAPARAEAEILS
jgi:hypothetical protein